VACCVQDGGDLHRRDHALQLGHGGGGAVGGAVEAGLPQGLAHHVGDEVHHQAGREDGVGGVPGFALGRGERAGQQEQGQHPGPGTHGAAPARAGMKVWA
jgi:hypothetical protein